VQILLRILLRVIHDQCDGRSHTQGQIETTQCPRGEVRTNQGWCKGSFSDENERASPPGQYPRFLQPPLQKGIISRLPLIVLEDEREWRVLLWGKGSGLIAAPRIADRTEAIPLVW
jgi:hypothetical protein